MASALSLSLLFFLALQTTSTGGVTPYYELEEDSTSCEGMNAIDGCWRCDPDWAKHRQRLADCATGFGRDAMGGKGGQYYVVDSDQDPDLVNPPEGTLRYAVIQEEPLWIVFSRDMEIELKGELIMNSFKTIDGRGRRVSLTGQGCITIQLVKHVILESLTVHGCTAGGNTDIRSSPGHYGFRGVSDGDAVSIWNARHVWVDHLSLTQCADGLVDVVESSTDVTISNNHLYHHDKAILLGHSDTYEADKDMRATVIYNRFDNLIERMPRCRWGYFDVVNNMYIKWQMYAIGGSANPTINSQANYFIPSGDSQSREVTKHMDSPQSDWENWSWRSVGDKFVNGAFFTASGDQNSDAFSKAEVTHIYPVESVPMLTKDAGVFTECVEDAICM